MDEKWKGLIKTAQCRLFSKITPDPKVWIFSSTDNRHFNYNSRYLFLYVLEHCPDLHPRFVINDDPAREALQRRYGRDYFIETKSEEGIRTVLGGGVWFTSAGLPVYGLHLAKGRRIINLWHGIPLKTIALMDRSESRLSRLYFRQIFSNNYTDVVTTSSVVSSIMQESLGVGPDKIRIWGQPRCDCLFAPFDRASFLAAQYSDLTGIRRTVLYAPTFRSDGPVQLFPFPDFDRAALDAYLEEHGILLCIRTHLAETAQRLPESRNLRYLNEDKLDDIMEGLQAFDLLVTDYSSIYLDYLLLDRPMIFLPYDLEEYRTAHGFSFPYEDVTPGEKPQRMAEFLPLLDQPAEADRFADARGKIKALFHENTYPCCGSICRMVREEEAE